MALKVITDYIPLGHPNRPGTKLYGLKARVWHGTANLNAGANDTMHRGYMGRAYKKVWSAGKGKYEFFEADGKTEFRYGGAHVFIDKDSATITAPLDEVVWGCGDRPLSANNGYNGQTKLAKEVFNNQNNYYTWNIELCMNDMAAWDKVLTNAIEFVQTYMPGASLGDYRHYDMTGKSCPSPLIGKAGDQEWIKFKQCITNALILQDSINLWSRALLNGKPVIGSPGDMLQEFRDNKLSASRMDAFLVKAASYATNIATAKDAVETWQALGVISSPGDMLKELDNGKLTHSRFDAFVNKSAKYIRERGMAK